MEQTFKSIQEPERHYSPRAKQMRDAWAELLLPKQWTAFCTFTSNYVMTAEIGHKRMEEIWLTIAGLQKGYRPEIFYVLEKYEFRSGYHAHALIKTALDGSKGLRVIKQAKRLVFPAYSRNRHHKAEIELFDPARGALHYVTKHMHYEEVEYDLLKEGEPSLKHPPLYSII